MTQQSCYRQMLQIVDLYSKIERLFWYKKEIALQTRWMRRPELPTQCALLPVQSTHCGQNDVTTTTFTSKSSFSYRKTGKRYQPQVYTWRSTLYTWDSILILEQEMNEMHVIYFLTMYYVQSTIPAWRLKNLEYVILKATEHFILAKCSNKPHSP
jgi:hypothetical protein